MASRPDNTDPADQHDETWTEPPQLLGSACEFLAGDIGETEWLNALKGYIGCDSILGGWWYLDDPGNYRTVSSSGPDIDVPVDWISRLDMMLNTTASLQTGLLHPPESSDVAFVDSSAAPIFGPDRIVIYIGFNLVRAVMIFSIGSDCKKADQFVNRVQKIAPHLEKMLIMKDHVNSLGDMLDLANAVFHSIPRGILTVLPNGKILKHNHRADELLKEGSLVYQKEGEFCFRDKSLQQELKEQLSIIAKMVPNTLANYAWYKQITNYDSSSSLLLTMRALPFDRSGPKVGPFKWALVITLSDAEANFSPSESKLREFFKLTRAEAAFVSEFLRTASIEEAAKARSISLNTARSHMRSIYGKVGVKNKAHLISKLSQSVIPQPSMKNLG